MRLIVLIILIFFASHCSALAEDLSLDRYTVQVYSSQSKEESKQFGQKFHSLGIPYVWPKTINGTIWYRVYIGAYEQKNEALDILEKIKIQLDIKDAFIKKIVTSD